MIVDALKIDNHILLATGIADALHEATARYGFAGESLEVYRPAILDVDRLGVD